jgi:site-specific DNA recombinase
MNGIYETKEAPATALIYCRVSSKKQTVDGTGLQSQEHRCIAHAAQRRYAVEKVFLESVSGGLDIANRPAMRDLLRYLDKQKKTGTRYVVIFDDHKRFARQTEVHLQLRRELELRGARVEYLNFMIEDSPEGKFIDTMLAAQAQLEREQIGRQTKQKTLARLERGYWTFRAPVGYKYVPSKQGGKELVINEPLASIVKEALEGFASGRFATQSEVKRFLEGKPEYPKDMPNGELRNQTIARLLEQLLYAGYLESPDWGVLRRKANHDALISLETFERVQERRKNNNYLPLRKDVGRDFVLRGAVCCHGCSKPLRSCWTKGNTKIYPYYLCQTKGCPDYGKSIARDKVEGAFETLLQEAEPPRSVVAVIRAMFKLAWDRQAEIAKATLQSLKQEVVKVEREIARLIERVMDASNPTVIRAYEQRIGELEKQKLIWQEKASKPTAPRHSFEEMLELTLLFFANPYKLWQMGGFEMKRTVLKLAFPGEITYDRNPAARTPMKAAAHRAFSAISNLQNQFGADERT